jgi:hypothetical protein
MPLGRVPYRIAGSGVTSVRGIPQPLAEALAEGAVAATAGTVPATMAIAMAALLTRENNGLKFTKMLPAPR